MAIKSLPKHYVAQFLATALVENMRAYQAQRLTAREWSRRHLELWRDAERRKVQDRVRELVTMGGR